MEMTTIWKYVFEVTDRVRLRMPRGAELLPFVADGGPVTLMVWALVDPEAPMEWTDLQVVGTGNPVPGPLGQYIGTAVAAPFVWHVFALHEEADQ